MMIQKRTEKLILIQTIVMETMEEKEQKMARKERKKKEEMIRVI